MTEQPLSDQEIRRVEFNLATLDYHDLIVGTGIGSLEAANARESYSNDAAMTLLIQGINRIVARRTTEQEPLSGT